MVDIRRGLGLVLALVVVGPTPAASDPPRFTTSRSARPLELPVEDDAFVFAIFGDRTGGPAEGVKVLADAVREVNLIEPDLVMTVGDLVEGYNETAAWMIQMREFRGIMDELACPWFPVAGNHDIYWRGPDRPAGQHEANYEMHFGPLWYAFEHKDAWFIVLYSDEGDPATGEKSFEDPTLQSMSDEQFAWLDSVLERSATGRHAFVFLHHPRWVGERYGDDWSRVHARLVEAGNVRAVFAGHIHVMQYDGPRDGIEYVTLATTGGAQSGAIPEAGYLHHFNLVTVRDDHIALATIPVGSVIDPRQITAAVRGQANRLRGTLATVASPVTVRDGRADQRIEVAVQNPTDHPIDLEVRLDSADSRWRWSPDHRHARLEPGASRVFAYHAGFDGAIDEAFRLPRIEHRADLLAPGVRIQVPAQQTLLPLAVELEPREGPDLVARFEPGDAFVLPSAQIALDDGPLTLECVFRGARYDGRRGLVTKTESSEYGLFVSDGDVEFIVHLDGRYATVRAEGVLVADRWHHLAGVYDGREIRVYLDGRRLAAGPASGSRTRNDLPLVIGGDVDARGRPSSWFAGEIDTVLLSSVARYTGEVITPAFTVDAGSVLAVDMDDRQGPWILDRSRHRAHPVAHGNPEHAPRR